MDKSLLFIFSIILVLSVFFSGCEQRQHFSNHLIFDNQGAIIQTDTCKQAINLVFTAHDFADGFDTIRNTLNLHQIKASFFFTGDFYRNPDFQTIIQTLMDEGHYLGAHSDKHLLYCSWEKRDSLLVSEHEFISDLEDNYAEMKRFGIQKEEAAYFIAPYEWYNSSISKWASEWGLTLFNFTPGTSSNQDWTYPEIGAAYKESETLVNNIFTYEKNFGMNGFILLIHPGTDPCRQDKLYFHLDRIIKHLKGEGYSFRRIDE